MFFLVVVIISCGTKSRLSRDVLFFFNSVSGKWEKYLLLTWSQSCDFLILSLDAPQLS